MADDPLLIDRRDGVLTLTINRPAQRNALSLALLDGIGTTLVGHVTDSELKCVVITAAGDKAFAAGGDLKELDAIRSAADAEAMSRRGRLALDRIREFPLPVVAGLNGLALGGGAELAMACDLRVASANAQIGFLQAQLNVSTAWGGGIDLINTVGSQRALELLLSARRLGAHEALEVGLFHHVCDDGTPLADGVQAFIAPFLQRGQQVLRGIKALTMTARQALHERLGELEQAHFVTNWIHADHWSAVEAAASARARKK